METGAMNEPVASTPLWYGAIRAYRVPAHPPTVRWSPSSAVLSSGS